MARRKSKIDLTLFPFMSVLAGLIAVLMLFMMVTVSTRAIEASDQAPRPAADAAGDGVGVEGGIDEKQYNERNKEIERLEGTLVRKRQDIAELKRKQELLRAMIDLKKDEKMLADRSPGRRKGVKLGAPDPVKFAFVPSKGQTVTKKPIFVEIDGEGYLVHPGPTRYRTIKEEKTGDKSKFRADPKLKAFLDKIDKNRDKEYLLFLLHPSGSPGYLNMRRYLLQDYSEKVVEGRFEITKSRIGTGTEPFSRDWILRIQ